jgi:CIC family chloride channel protein
MDESQLRRRGALAFRDASFFALVVLVGLAGGLAACLFRSATRGLGSLLYQQPDDLEPGVATIGLLGRVLVPAAGGFLAGVIGWLAARQKGGHGIPEIMEAVTLRRGVVSLVATITKALAGLVTIVSGGSVGREGPIVQVGAALGSRAGRLLLLSERRVRVLAAAGCAAGLAAAYDAPIGAVVFVAEVVAGTFAPEVLLPAMGASVFATTVTRAWFGPEPLFRVPPFELVSVLDSFAHAFVGLAAGLLGHFFLRALDLGERAFARFALPRPLAGALGGLAVGLIGAVIPQVYGNGFEATSQVLEGRFTAIMLGVILLAKIAATSITVSSGAPGGVFTPTLLCGACLGGSLGQAVNALAPHAIGSPGGYALVGMAAALSATTHAPVLSSVMVFEMSGDYSIVLPLLLATSIAAWASRLLSPRSVYTRELARRGVAWEGSIEERLARGITARDLVDEDAVLLSPATPFAQVRRMFTESRARSLFVGDERTGLLGAIDLHCVKLHLDSPELDATVVAADLVVPTPIAAPDDTLLDLSRKMHRLDFGDLPVVDPGPPSRLLGVITRRDLLAAFDSEILQRDLLVTRIVWREGKRLASELLELPEGARIAEIRVPGELAGRALREARMRETQGVNVIAVVRHVSSRADAGCLLPTPDLVLEKGDRLVVVVPGKE